MSFLAPDEFLILLDPQPSWLIASPYILSLQDKIVLREAGIQTTNGDFIWGEIEPLQGEYDFSDLERQLEMNREAGIKSRFHVPNRTPAWMSDEWMLQTIDGRAQIRRDGIPERYLSFWNEEAQEYCDDYLRLLIERYHAPDVMFVYGESQSGEGVLPMEPFYYDEFAIADYKDRCGTDAYPDINIQETRDWLQESAIKRTIRVHKTINQHKEIWNWLQPLMDDWSKSCVNFALEEILRACKVAFPDSLLVIEQDTFWDSSHTEQHRSRIDAIAEELQCEVIVEAMWPSGLPTTTPLSIARGYRGQIVGPSHPHFPKLGSLEPWVVANIKEAHRQWLESSQ